MKLYLQSKHNVLIGGGLKITGEVKAPQSFVLSGGREGPSTTPKAPKGLGLVLQEGGCPRAELIGEQDKRAGAQKEGQDSTGAEGAKAARGSPGSKHSEGKQDMELLWSFLVRILFPP